MTTGRINQVMRDRRPAQCAPESTHWRPIDRRDSPERHPKTPPMNGDYCGKCLQPCGNACFVLCFHSSRKHTPQESEAKLQNFLFISSAAHDVISAALTTGHDVHHDRTPPLGDTHTWLCRCVPKERHAFAVTAFGHTY